VAASAKRIWAAGGDHVGRLPGGGGAGDLGRGDHVGRLPGGGGAGVLAARGGHVGVADLGGQRWPRRCARKTQMAVADGGGEEPAADEADGADDSRCRWRWRPEVAVSVREAGTDCVTAQEVRNGSERRRRRVATRPALDGADGN
jgi:hypothetical protein